MSRRTILLAFFLLAPFAARAADVPALQGRVNDYANLISPDQKQRIEAQLAQFEQQTSNQVSVLTIPTLDGEDIEGYAHRVATAWGLGQKGKDNGALLIVAQKDRKMRIEVGYGLEPVLTDLQTSIIQNEVIIPYFKRGDFGGGIEAGVSGILSTIQGKPVEPAAVQEPAGGGQGEDGSGGLSFLIFALFALGPFVLNAIRSGSWVVYVILLPILFFLGSLVSVVFGLIVAGLWLVLFPILRAILPKRPTSGRFGGRRGGGGWWIGPGFGGGGGGGWGGGGGGGFSGGGGSFGGGGSSSSW
jgi:uncharacterized protein